MSQVIPLPEEGGVHRDSESDGVVPGPSGNQWNPPHLNRPPPSLRLTEIIAIGTVVGNVFVFFWKLDYGTKVVKDFYHHNPMTSHAILIIGVVIVYVFSFWLVVKLGEVPHLEDRYFALAVALLISLVITLILNAVLPNKYSWIVWILYAATIRFMLVKQGWTDKIRTLVMQGCEYANGWKDKIHTLVMQGCERATRWKNKIRRSVVERYKRATQWTDKISLF